jgi:hypothetical protein
LRPPNPALDGIPQGIQAIAFTATNADKSMDFQPFSPFIDANPHHFGTSSTEN